MKKMHYLFAIVLASLTFSCADELVSPRNGDDDDVIVPPPPPPPPPPPTPPAFGGNVASDTTRVAEF